MVRTPPGGVGEVRLDNDSDPELQPEFSNPQPAVWTVSFWWL